MVNAIIEIHTRDAQEKEYVWASNIVTDAEVIPTKGDYLPLRTIHVGDADAIHLRVTGTSQLISLDGFLIVIWLSEEDLADYGFASRLWAELSELGWELHAPKPTLPEGADADDFDE